MVSADDNHDIVSPMLRPDLDAQDKYVYESICQDLGFDPSLKDDASYMQFMNYNQICYLELIPTANTVLQFYQERQQAK